MNSCKNNIVEPSLSQKKKKKKKKRGGKEKKKKSIPSEGTHFLFHLWTSFSFQFLLSPYFLSRVEIHFNPFLTFYYIYIFLYNLSFQFFQPNRIRSKKKNLSSILSTMLTKKKKKKKINQRSRRIYFHVTFQSFRITLSLSLHRSYTPSAFARRIFTVRFRPFRGQQSPKYQTTLLTYRTFNNPSLGERNANNIEQIYRRLGPAGERTGE